MLFYISCALIKNDFTVISKFQCAIRQSDLLILYKSVFKRRFYIGAAMIFLQTKKRAAFLLIAPFK